MRTQGAGQVRHARSLTPGIEAGLAYVPLVLAADRVHCEEQRQAASG